jgi:hypothetical protein
MGHGIHQKHLGQVLVTARSELLHTKRDLKVCDDGTLVQILCFWALSIVLSLS